MKPPQPDAELADSLRSNWSTIFWMVKMPGDNPKRKAVIKRAAILFYSITILSISILYFGRMRVVMENALLEKVDKPQIPIANKPGQGSDDPIVQWNKLNALIETIYLSTKSMWKKLQKDKNYGQSKHLSYHNISKEQELFYHSVLEYDWLLRLNMKLMKEEKSFASNYLENPQTARDISGILRKHMGSTTYGPEDVRATFYADLEQRVKMLKYDFPLKMLTNKDYSLEMSSGFYEGSCLHNIFRHCPLPALIVLSGSTEIFPKEYKSQNLIYLKERFVVSPESVGERIALAKVRINRKHVEDALEAHLLNYIMCNSGILRWSAERFCREIKKKAANTDVSKYVNLIESHLSEQRYKYVHSRETMKTNIEISDQFNLNVLKASMFMGLNQDELTLILALLSAFSIPTAVIHLVIWLWNLKKSSEKKKEIVSR